MTYLGKTVPGRGNASQQLQRVARLGWREPRGAEGGEMDGDSQGPGHAAGLSGPWGGLNPPHLEGHWRASSRGAKWSDICAEVHTVVVWSTCFLGDEWVNWSQRTDPKGS